MSVHWTVHSLDWIDLGWIGCVVSLCVGWCLYCSISCACVVIIYPFFQWNVHEINIIVETVVHPDHAMCSMQLSVRQCFCEDVN